MADRRTHEQRMLDEIENIKRGRMSARMEQVLSTVRSAGPPGITHRDLCEALGMSRTNAGNYLQRLRLAGLIGTTREGAASGPPNAARWCDARYATPDIAIDTPRQLWVNAAACHPVQTTGSRGAFWR